MATAVQNDSRLTITLQTGVDTEGNPIFKRKGFYNVKFTATNDQLYNMVQVLSPLQQHSVNNVERTEAFDLRP